MAETVGRHGDQEDDQGREPDQQAEDQHALEEGARHTVALRGRADEPPAAVCGRRLVAEAAEAHSYTSRYLRTSRMLMMFMSSVATNSVEPTAKMVLYSTLPVGTSPMPTCAM